MPRSGLQRDRTVAAWLLKNQVDGTSQGVDDLVTCRMHFRVVPFLFESKARHKPALAVCP